MSKSVKCRAADPSVCRFHGNPGSGRIVSVPVRGVDVPVRVMEGLTHVGTLVPSAKKAFSYEGEGLSVSLHPDEWEKIARLSGERWRVGTALRLLDFHSLSEETKRGIVSYGVEHGWVERARTYKVSWFDDEWEQEMSFVFTDEGEALEEADNMGVEVEVSDDWVATNSFPDATVKPGDSGAELLGKLVVVWVGRSGSDVDGVWWEDTLDVSRLSAPRGVICVNKVAGLLKHFSQ